MSRLLKQNARTARDWRSFRNDRRGNIAIIFALAMVPLVGLVGLGIDYGVALSDKSKLDNAADAAAVAAVATAKAFVAANQSDGNLTQDAIAAGLNQAGRTFTVNAGNVPFAPIPVPTTFASTAPATNTCSLASACIYLTKTNQTFTATVYYNTASKNHFGTLFKQPTMTIAGGAVASADIPSYLDFYLAVDVSGSMGLPSTSAGAATLANANGGCQFACHFPGQTGGYNYAIQNNIQLRSGAVNAAVCGLLVLASTPVVPHQYRVGIYPFINQVATLANIGYADPAPTVATPYANPLWNAAGCTPTSAQPYYATSNPAVFTSLLDTGTTQGYANNDPSTGSGSGGTHFETIFPLAMAGISPFGDGSSSAKSRPFLFLITDGMQNSQHYSSFKGGTRGYPGSPSTFSGYGSAYFDGSSPQAMDPTQCTALKNAGATISVLYIPYVPLTVGSQNQAETIASNNAIPNLPVALQQCANAGFFYTANTPADINNALSNMFKQAVQVAHLNR